MLHEFITENRAELIERARAKARDRETPKPTEIELEHGVPDFLNQLTDRLKPSATTTARIRDAAVHRGSELMRMGMTIGQVVHDYGDICQAITEAATAHRAPITTLEFRNLNQCLDDAIAEAVTEFSRAHDRGVAKYDSERRGDLTQELLKYITTATLAYEAIAKGTVGIRGSTGAILGRSLLGLRRVTDRAIAAVRLDREECVQCARAFEEGRTSSLPISE